MAGQSAVILGLEGPVLGREEAAFFGAANPYGFILFARNITDPVQLTALTADLRACVGADVPVLIDQEGGRVQRMRAPHWREWLPPLEQAALASDPIRAAWLRARIMAAELRACGVDANCAPCADIASEATHPFLRNRCYGADPAQVAQIARAVAEAHLAGGVLPVIKHLPGHGRSTADTHHDLPTVDLSAADLDRTDFAPFRALADLPLAMTAHIVFSAYDSRPATQGLDRLGMAQILQMDAHAGIEEGQFAQAMFERLVVELDHAGEGGRATLFADGRHEGDFRAAGDQFGALGFCVADEGEV